MDTIYDLAKGAQHVGPNYFKDLKGLDSQATYFVAGPVSEQLILAAETKLRVPLPKEYRKFISSYGAMLGNGYQLFGLTPEVDSQAHFFRNIVQETLHSPANRSTSSAPRYIAISNDGMDIDFLIDTQANPETRVVAYGPDMDWVIIANSLDEFWRGMMLDAFAAKLNTTQLNK